MLDQLKEQYQNYLASNPFRGNPAKLYTSMNYVMQLGGKRIRPILTLLGAKAVGGNIHAALPVAHAMEVFHNFTLAHDDIMDKAPTRRGKPALHVKEDIATAILAGDNMLIATYDLILQAETINKMPILETLSRTAREVCEGQQMDMDFEQEESTELDRYIEMIRLKTAVLLGCCLKCGSLTANAEPQVSEALYRYGEQVGIAFQIMDDYLDAFGKPELTGKQAGGDILAAKKTALFTLAWQKASDKEKSNLLLWFDKSKTDAETRLQHTLNLFRKLEVDKASSKLMERYFAQAEGFLQNSTLPPDAYKPLVELIGFLRARER